MLPRSLRIVGALGVLVGALVHGYLYFNGYGPDDLPAPQAYITDPGIFEVGRLFLANAATGILIALALFLLPHRRGANVATLLGIGWAIAALLAFYLSRNLDDGLFGFVEKGFEPSPEAPLGVAAEVIAIVALAAALVASRTRSRLART